MVLLIAWVLSFSPRGGENNKKAHTEELLKVRNLTNIILESRPVNTLFVNKKSVIVQEHRIKKIIKVKTLQG